VLTLTRDISAGTFLAVVLHAIGAAVLYFALFFGFAISRKDRRYYIAKALELSGRRPVPTAA
jgi:hypothetical protein